MGAANHMRCVGSASRDGQLARHVVNERNDAQDRHHNGCSSRHVDGGSGERPLDREAEVRVTCLPGVFAAGEPEARQVPLPLREERNETMGLQSSQVVEEGAQGNGSGATPSGGVERRALGRVVVYHQWRLSRRSTRRERLQRIVHRTVGHDNPMGGALPVHGGLGHCFSRRGLWGSRGRSKQTQVVVRLDGWAMAQYLPALRSLLQIGGSN